MRFRACAHLHSRIQAARACLSADFPPCALFPMSDEDNDRFVRTSRLGAALGMQISASFSLLAIRARAGSRASRELFAARVVSYVVLILSLSILLAFYSICTAAVCASRYASLEAFLTPLARSMPRVSSPRYRSTLSGRSTSIAKERASNRPAMKYQSAGSLCIIIASSAARALPVATGRNIFMTKRRERRAPTG
jgi:hypothetical protein